ncbi:unnamed protein product [Lactuca virosa]|uniref:Uncharacterized protein n=1 Tax=Lactuca virosa TaxID=75947 RepID=A0AAU9N5M7_9ASTR|nr:unnamed protein product [Lactuca virosa]
MKYPLLFSSPQFSTKLRVLRLHQSSLESNLSSIANMLNLEVLSFASSGVVGSSYGIDRMPSTFKNLKKLRVLDVTGCNGLRIDNGVFKILVRLEEL